MPVAINHIGTSGCSIHYENKDSHGVLARYDLDTEDLLQLCGGIPGSSQLFANVVIESKTLSTVTVTVDSDLYRVVRTINFEIKVIFNDKMRVFQKNEYIGTSLFLNQVFYARKLGFIKLKVFASDFDGEEKADGYYRWARLGYQMTDRNDLEDFAAMMRTLGRDERTVGELTLS